jgi:hypothetical protein
MKIEAIVATTAWVPNEPHDTKFSRGCLIDISKELVGKVILTDWDQDRSLGKIISCVIVPLSGKVEGVKATVELHDEGVSFGEYGDFIAIGYEIVEQNLKSAENSLQLRIEVEKLRNVKPFFTNHPADNNTTQLKKITPQGSS